MKTRKPFPPPLYTFAEHITAPAPAWHDNPVLVLARDLERMTLIETVRVNEYLIRKTWSMHTGNRYAVCSSAGRHLKAFKCAKAASAYVYAGNLVNQQEMSE